jgi:hypothetical protein
MSDSRADQSCLACKKLKRKCDKQLPTCALCSRTRRPCEYPGDAAPPVPAPTAADFAALQARLNDLESRLYGPPVTDPSSVPAPSGGYAAELSLLSPGEQGVPVEAPPARFPAALFLDIHCFKWIGIRLPKRSTSIPAVCLDVMVQNTLPLPGAWSPTVARNGMVVVLSAT